MIMIMSTHMDAGTRKRWRCSGLKGGVVSVTATPQQDGSCCKMKFSGIISSSLSAIEEYDMEHGSLDMNNLQLQAVPEELTELENIRSLILSGNVLSELPPFMYEWSSLVILDISYNAISCLPSTIENWTSLERLDVSHNRLVSLPTSLVKLQSLRELFVDNNEITEVPVELCGCRSLEILSARKNLLGTIPLDLCLCENLHTVSLSGNPLESPFAEYVAMGSSAVVRFLGQMRSRKLSTEQSRRARPFASVVTEGGVKREKEHKEKDISGKKGEKEHKDKDKDKEKEKDKDKEKEKEKEKEKDLPSAVEEVKEEEAVKEEDLQQQLEALQPSSLALGDSEDVTGAVQATEPEKHPEEDTADRRCTGDVPMSEAMSMDHDVNSKREEASTCSQEEKEEEREEREEEAVAKADTTTVEPHASDSASSMQLC